MSDATMPVNGVLLEALTWREQDVLSLLAERLTNREIAQSLGLELTTVKWYNRQIYDKLGVSNRREAVARIAALGLLEEQPAATASAQAPPEHRLPAPVTSFIGRERDIAEVQRLLQSARLVTLTGPGGIGKTRLALRVVAQVMDDFGDGVFFIDLSPINQPGLVADTIADALDVMVFAGQTVSDRLATFLGHKKVLLLVDNFEHLLEAASLVGELLSAAPNLKVLVTSREALRLYGEQEYPVPPLGLPDLDNPDSLSALADCEAAVLFAQRAQAVKPDFTLTNEDAPLLAEICIRLDGLPLAIELAAARVKLFSPQALLGQLASRFAALQDGPRGLPARQRTLRGAIDWSYNLLDDAEKLLFSRLSVFQGGRTIEAVEAVCCHDLSVDVLDGLVSLLNKNLLRQEEGPEGEPRFVMLETIHEYARGRLRDSGEAEVMQRRHAEYFTALAERAEPYTRGGPDQMRWLRRLEAEHDNLRTTYTWAVDGGNVGLGLRLVGALGYFWWRQGHYAEGREWTAWAREVTGRVSPSVQANVCFAAGIVYKFYGDLDNGKRMFLEALAYYRDIGASRDIGWTLVLLSYLSVGREDEYEQAVVLGEEGLNVLRQIGDRPGAAQALNNLGELARLQGDLARAKEAYEESLNVAREIGDGLRESILLINLAFIALHEDDAARAQAMLKESLTLALKIGHTAYVADKLSSLAGAAVALGQPERAARLTGAAEALYETQGFEPQVGDLPEFERYRAAIREQLDKATFETARAEGRAMNLEEAIAYALADSDRN